MSELSGLAPSQIESLFLRASKLCITWSHRSPYRSHNKPEYDHLESYSNKPDCFRRVANLIRTHCSELIMDEHARVQGKVTISFDGNFSFIHSKLQFK